MKPTLVPPEQDEQDEVRVEPAIVLPDASASTVEPPPPPPVVGTARISRVSPGRRLALYEFAPVPPLAPDQRLVTSALPENPTCDQLTLTVAVPLVAVLNSATTYDPSASFLLKTCCEPLLTIRL